VERRVGVHFNSPFSIEGWAFDERNSTASEDLYLVLATDSGAFCTKAIRTRREDLPTAYGSPDLLNAGFQVRIERLCIPHDIYSLKLIESASNGYVLHDLGITLVLTSSRLDPPTHLLRDTSQSVTTGRIDSIAGRELTMMCSGGSVAFAAHPNRWLVHRSGAQIGGR